MKLTDDHESNLGSGLSSLHPVYCTQIACTIGILPLGHSHFIGCRSWCYGRGLSHVQTVTPQPAANKIILDVVEVLTLKLRSHITLRLDIHVALQSYMSLKVASF